MSAVANCVSEWVSGNRNNIAQWDYSVSGGVAYHRVYRQTQQLFSEASDQAEWGYWYWATDQVDGLTFQSGRDVDVRGAFSSNGSLANTKDSNYRAIQSNWPVFGFAVDLGSVGASGASTLFTIGLAQRDAVQFLGAKGVVALPALWTSYFNDDLAAVSRPSPLMKHLSSKRLFFQLEFFHKDFPTQQTDSLRSWTTKSRATRLLLRVRTISQSHPFRSVRPLLQLSYAALRTARISSSRRSRRTET